MEQAVRTETRRSGVAEADDPFRYGWRYVRRTQPDGTVVIEEIPLTHDDLLYPEEGDFVVQEPWHTQDFTYCYSALTAFCRPIQCGGPGRLSSRLGSTGNPTPRA